MKISMIAVSFISLITSTGMNSAFAGKNDFVKHNKGVEIISERRPASDECKEFSVGYPLPGGLAISVTTGCDDNDVPFYIFSIHADGIQDAASVNTNVGDPALRATLEKEINTVTKVCGLTGQDLSYLSGPYTNALKRRLFDKANKMLFNFLSVYSDGACSHTNN